MFDQQLAEDIGPGVVIGYPHLAVRGRRKCGAVAFTAFDGCEQLDTGKALECSRHREQFRLGKGIADLAAKAELPDAGRLRRMGRHHDGIGHDGVVSRCRRDTIPAW